MKTQGVTCRPIADALEESSISLKEQAEIITLLGWGDQARVLEELSATVEKIARMVRSGSAQAPAYLTRNA